MKYTSNCCFAVLPFCIISFSISRVPLTVECMAETYRMSGCPCSGLDSVGKCSRYLFKSSKAFCYSAPHSTFTEPLSMAKKGKLHSASFDMN
jgi:hypothetical protein